MSWLKDISKDNFIFVKWFAIVNVVGFVLSMVIWFLI